MESSQFEQRAIQLVSVTPEGKYEMHPMAEMFLRKIPKPIAVVSVAGLYRTGKSYLLNRILLNRNNGFGVGPTINPCTKGLWCWGVPLKGLTPEGEKVNVLIIDSEGIGALDEDQNHDIKIFTLAILSSSTFIYNSVGSIDENALQNLSMVVNLTKNIQLNTHNQEQEEDPDELARYFPTFFWVVRDFSLQLVSSEGDAITPKDYLERALAPQKGFSDDVQQKNRIRRLLTAFFKDRDCATLVRPLVNQQKLQHLYECSFDDLRPEFVEQALSLRKKVLSNAKPKMLKGEYLDGTMYISMLNSYLTAINNGGVPNIQNAWTYMCIEKCMKLQEQCYDFFVQEMERTFDNLPCEVGEFETEIENIQTECFKMFESQQIGEQSQSYFQELKAKIKERISLLRIQNQRESINYLKNYIIKNFSVIEKKMKMNEFQTYQEYLKAINNFYLYLVENGPDLPKKEIVYLDFSKKVTAQGAEIFIKQINQNLESARNLSIEKEKIFKLESEELKSKIKADSQKFKSKFDNLYMEKLESQKKVQQVTDKYQTLKISSQNEISKLEASYQNKIKNLQSKINQTSLTLEDLKQKKETLQTTYIFQKKQREKEKALMQLKMNQYKDQLKSLKIKEKNQEIYINDMNVETNSKIKEITLDYERKVFNLSEELNRIKELYDETVELKDDLQNKLKNAETSATINNKKYQQELRSQVQKYQNYKNLVQTEKTEQNKKLQLQNVELQTNLSKLQAITAQYERKIKQLTDKLKSSTGESEKEIAILKQKIQFLTQQAAENKEKFNKSFQHYESMLKSQSEMKEETLRMHYKTQISEIEEDYGSKISRLESQLATIKEKYQQETASFRKSEDNFKFSHDLQVKQLQSEIRNQALIIENLERQKESLVLEKQQLQKDMQEKIEIKQAYYEGRITMLEEELQVAMDSATRQQSEFNNKSEESLRQLKNYYELDREKLEQRIANDKQKYEKRINELRDQHERQLDEERETASQQYLNLKEELQNEIQIMRKLIVNLQNEKDNKEKALQNIQSLYKQVKEKLQKKEVDFGNKMESLHKNYSLEKQALQQRIIESNEVRSKLQKEILVIGHQKDQLAKQIKDLTAKYQVKIEEIFYLNKSMEKSNNETRQKLSELNNDYMNERLNYQKKIALGEQQKQFYIKKIEEYEKEQTKNSTALDQITKKLINEHQQEIRSLETKKNIEYMALQAKYDKLKKTSKQTQQQINRNINELQKQLALQQEKFNNLQEKYEQLEEKRSNDGNYLATELNNVRQQLGKVTKDYSQEISKLKKQLNDAINDKNQIQILYQKDKILLENKNIYLEDTKQKNKKEYLQKIKNLEQTIENIQKNRMNDKNYYEQNHTENVAKIEKKYNNIIQQNYENWIKKERQYEVTIKQLQHEMRSLNEKMGNQLQVLSQTNKTQERRLRQLQQSERRAVNQLEKYKSHRQTSTSETQVLIERERESMKQKMQQKQQKYKNLEKVKQQIYYNFQKEKARWNLEKQNYLMRNDELKEVISKQEKDLQKLTRQNQKLKAEKKNNKLSGLSSYTSKYFERGNSRQSLEDSTNSFSMSISKQNCSPLGELSFFNNQ